MDVRKYLGSVFWKPEDVRDGPIQVKITDVSKNKYDKLNLQFDDGSQLSVNSINGHILAKAYGWESDNWIGKTIELSLGEGEYDGNKFESIVVKPISPPNKKSNLDDTIPF